MDVARICCLSINNGMRDILYTEKQILHNIKNGKNKIWDGFRDKEMMVYTMKSEDYEEGMDKRERILQTEK